MPKIEVNDALVRRLAEEVGPLVQEITAWDLHLDSLRCRVLPKDRGYEEIILTRLRGIGLNITDDAPRGLFERLVEYLVEGNTQAAYETSTQELLIVRENVDDGNLDGLRLVIAHELVHRGQQLHQGHLFARVDEVTREAIEAFISGKAMLPTLRRLMETITPVMNLIESHALFVQALIGRTYFPHARLESHHDLASLLMRVFGRRKLRQYTDGLPAVAKAAADGTVESLYENLRSGA